MWTLFLSMLCISSLQQQSQGLPRKANDNDHSSAQGWLSLSPPGSLQTYRFRISSWNLHLLQESASFTSFSSPLAPLVTNMYLRKSKPTLLKGKETKTNHWFINDKTPHWNSSLAKGWFYTLGINPNTTLNDNFLNYEMVGLG